MKAKERHFYDKYLKIHAQLAEDAIAKGAGIGKGSKGSRSATAGKEGCSCYSNICGKPGAFLFCHMNRQWYCKQCADIMNHYADLSGLDPVCVTAGDKCGYSPCKLFDDKCDLNCSGWGLNDTMSPIECIRSRGSHMDEWDEGRRDK